ncbi:FkbM family methyltransferase [Streptomyces sp. NPDC002896]|uniref:FkbM family methyltransferase n=1 Tax=Streptomyces sp. NPDC002896 TaxID=3154438 RepID=UPI003333B9AB
MRLVAAVATEREGTALVDIGANVGDSVVLIRQALHMPILCVEGDELFLGLLRRNIADLPDVDIEEAFVATGHDDRAPLHSVRREAGTAALVPSSSGLPLRRPVRPLTDILRAHPRFSSPGFLKIDTDGADTRIIVNNKEILARTRPVVFFEFDPNLAARSGDTDPCSAITALADAGYKGALVYNNTGELMLVTDVTATPTWQDLVRYVLVRGLGHYYDVAAFHQNDQELFQRVSAAERQFFDHVT